MEHAKPITFISAQREILERASEIIALNLADPDFNAERLCEELNMAKVRLHRKLVNAGGLPPVSMIRKMRMDAAKQLIITSYGNVSQIMYAVGYTHLSVFSNTFKKQFGLTPNAMIRNWINFRRTE